MNVIDTKTDQVLYGPFSSFVLCMDYSLASQTSRVWLRETMYETNYKEDKSCSGVLEDNILVPTYTQELVNSCTTTNGLQNTTLVSMHCSE